MSKSLRDEFAISVAPAVYQAARSDTSALLNAVFADAKKNGMTLEDINELAESPEMKQFEAAAMKRVGEQCYLLADELLAARTKQP